jgi:hypothetical protein
MMKNLESNEILAKSIRQKTLRQKSKSRHVVEKPPTKKSKTARYWPEEGTFNKHRGPDDQNLTEESFQRLNTSTDSLERYFWERNPNLLTRKRSKESFAGNFSTDSFE